MKRFAGSSVVTRHCRAKPCVPIAVLSRQADLRVGQALPLGDQNLAFDDVDAGHHLGHGVLDLDARIDLDEIETRRCRRRAGTRPCRHCRGGRPGRRPGRHRRIAVATAGSRFEAGAISTTFWCRRCTEQSRSKRWTRLPCWSPSSCTSMCRARAMYFSRNTSAMPNAAAGLAAGLVQGLIELVGACGHAHARGRRRPSPP